jgi:hypothetical protein
MDLIDWLALTRALNRNRAKEVSLVKPLAEITPTALITKRYSPLQSSKCPRCKTDDESIDHVIRCSAAACQTWRSALLTHLRLICTTTLHSRLALVDVLLAGLSSWFQHELLDHMNYPPSLHKLIQDQNSIGWNQLFRGRMVKEWARLQQQSLSDNGCQKPTLSGRSWVATVVTTLWTRFFELWAERNTLVHGASINDVTAVQKSKLLAELQDLHSRRDSFHHSDLPFLIAPSDADTQKLVDFVDTNYVSTIRTWLRMWTPTLEDGARLASAQTVQGTGRIFDHFPVVHRVLRNKDPIHRGRQRSRPVRILRQRVDMSRFHRITSFFRTTPAPLAIRGTRVPTDQILELP